MLVISDTTPIISLMKAEKLELLQKMFETVIVPDAVYYELTENPLYSTEASQIISCSFIHKEKVDNEEAVHILRKVTGLDAGESEAIVMIDEKKADLLLMDEHKGRQIAKKMGITITGTVGILIQAFDENMLTEDEICGCLEKLRESNVRISESLYNLVLKHLDKKKSIN